MRGRLLLPVMAAIVGCWAIPGAAKPYIANGFTVPFKTEKTIAVFRPDVTVGSMTAGGVEEPNADWTATSRQNLATALRSDQETQANKLIFLDEMEGDQGKLVADYQALFQAVGFAMLSTNYGRALPTKKARPIWTMGPDLDGRIRAATGADYGLMLFVHDAYGTAGRKAAQLFLAMAGVGIVAGIHMGYAALVDFETGDVRWFNIDIAAGGDPRTADGASKRVGQILGGLSSTPATTTTKK